MRDVNGLGQNLEQNTTRKLLAFVNIRARVQNLVKLSIRARVYTT